MLGARRVNEDAQPLTVFGRNLARLRSERELTQEGLAERVNVHPRYLQKLEGGTAHPSLMVLRRIRQSLNCRWEELLKDV